MGNSKSRPEHNNYSSRPKEFPNFKARENSSFKPYQPQINISTTTNPLGYNHGAYKPASERKTQDFFQEFNKSHLTRNDTVNVQPKFMTKPLINKEKCDNGSQTYPQNKSAIVTEPPKISTKDDFMMEWFSWKNEFLTFVKLIDQEGKNKKQWGIMLLNRMGPVGQEIYGGFIFDKECDKGDIDTLLKKFDFYCIFGDRKKGDDEDIDKYVNYLMVMASKHMTNTDEIIKEKILMEIDKDRFTKRARSLISGFLFLSDIKLLTLKEMTYIWMSYEHPNYKVQSEEIYNLVKNCSNCGETHKLNHCRAYGKRCNECGIENHFWMRCPSQLITDCKYCGDTHFKRDCPSYLNECSKCKRTNHFSWKCPIVKVLNCKFCGLTHIASKSACSAVNTICYNCGERGHVPAKCYKNKH